jgi:hypothetical protein
MGEKDLFDFYSDTYKVHSLDWSREKAAEILADWQGKFSREVTRLTMEKSLSKKYDINAYSNYQLDEIMEEFSEFSLVNLAIGLGLMVNDIHLNPLGENPQLTFKLSFNLDRPCTPP